MSPAPKYVVRLYSNVRDLNDHDTRVIDTRYLKDALLHIVNTMNHSEESWLYRIEIDRVGILGIEEPAHEPS